MRRLILIFVIFVILGIGLALVFREHSGYVLISFSGWRVETSLLLASAALLVGLWLLLTLWRLLVALALLPRGVRRWRARRRARKARRSLDAGLLKYAEGNWSGAESDIQRLAERQEAPAISYIYAAHAAQRQGHSHDRDRYLEQAASGDGGSELAVLLTQAELQIDQGQHDEALASLARLHEIESHHPYILELYGEQCASSGDYAKLRLLIPDLYKHSTLGVERVDELAAEAWDDAFKRAGGEVEALNEAWKQVPKRLRGQPAMVAVYVRYLHAAGADDRAAKMIRRVLKHDWSAQLVLLFGDIETDDASAQLAATEKWLKQYGEEPELLLVAGRLCMRNQLWGRARSYFETSLKNASRPDALLELGRLFEEIDQPNDARNAYRQGLEMRFLPTGPGARVEG